MGCGKKHRMPKATLFFYLTSAVGLQWADRAVPWSQFRGGARREAGGPHVPIGGMPAAPVSPAAARGPPAVIPTPYAMQNVLGRGSSLAALASMFFPAGQPSGDDADLLRFEPGISAPFSAPGNRPRLFSNPGPALVRLRAASTFNAQRPVLMRPAHTRDPRPRSANCRGLDAPMVRPHRQPLSPFRCSGCARRPVLLRITDVGLMQEWLANRFPR